MFLQLRTALILCSWAMAFSFGCERRDQKNAPTIKTGSVLHLGNYTEPADLDPQTVTGRPESTIIRALIEGLVTPDPRTMEPIPGVAERWEVSDDGRVYTFHLRSGARWSNGDPVTAHDFVASWKRMLTPSLGAEYAYNLFLVEGAEAYHRGELPDFAQTGFRVIDERTLRVELRNPTSYFLQLLLHPSWSPVPVKTVERFGGLARKGTAWTRAENYVGNGPFVLKEWRPNQVVVVAKSPTYWDRDRVRLDEVRFYPLESYDTEERMFRAGQLHVTASIPLNKIDRYREEQPEVFRSEPYLAAAYFRVQVKRPPLNDPRVRRALALALDRVSLAKNVLRGVKTPAYVLTPPGTAGFQPPPQFSDNPDHARALLAEAGYPGGRGFPTIEILYPTSDNGRIVCEALQEMWRRQLGIDVRLHNQEWKVYLDSMNTENYQLAWSAWGGDYVDPMAFLDQLVTDGGNNRTGWSNVEYDRLLSDVQRVTHSAERLRLFERMEELIGEEVPVIPLYHHEQTYLARPEVKGWYPTLLHVHPLQYVWLETGK
jgi:oligopeptide transport system substrate-binding protein